MFQIFCDFDGTITLRDSIVFLTDHFGGGSEFREEIFSEIRSGRMTVFEAIEQELKTVTVSWAEALATLRAEIQIDPTFEAFVRWCQHRQWVVSVVSSGLRPVVEAYVGELNLPVYAHDISCDPEGWQYRRRAGMEKTTVLARHQSGPPIVFIGDGSSDISAVPYTDILFAKDYLAEYCRQRGIPFLEFRDFEDVRLGLQSFDSS